MMDDHCDVDHPRSSKRLCSNTGGSNNGDAVANAKRLCSNNNGHRVDAKGKARDCYQEMTACADRQLVPPLLRHDWFYEIPTISKFNNGATAAVAAANANAVDLAASSEELPSLDRQLQQVKRRFQESSERCAEAVEAYATNTTPNYEFEQGRRACNPMEVLGETRPGGLNHALFLNRSAIKLANIDAQLNFTLLTNNHHHYQQQHQPQNSITMDHQHHHDVQEEDTFYFADLCAAPGGFSEYLLRRFCHSLNHKKGNHLSSSNQYTSCRGYGMSLEGDNDQGHGTQWKISPGPLFMGGKKNKNKNGGGGGGVYYHICRGEDGTGDIFQWRNVQALQNDIASQQQNMTRNQHTNLQQQEPQPRVATGRVALVLADGGVDAQRNIEHPEAETQKLVVCQVAAALALLQPGGRLVLKLLGCQTTPILQCVLQELYDNFHHLQVLKPISSRPASAERYLVCTGYLGCPTTTTTSATNSNGNNNVQQNNNDEVFDGPRWINRVLLGQFKITPALATFLAQVDCDMMRLNLNACFAILSNLDSKTMRLTTPPAAVPMAMQPGNHHRGSGDRGDDDAMKDAGDDEDEKWIAQGYNNYHSRNHQQQQHHHKAQLVKAYRAAWKLF